MITLSVSPKLSALPKRGGVKEHMLQLYKQINAHPETRMAVFEEADIQHVESSYVSSTNETDVYVCHGGFVPTPLPAVEKNLKEAKIIITVARWIAHRYFPELRYKTVHIPNGVDLEEWKDVKPSGLEPGYVLYAKEWNYFFEAFMVATRVLPNTQFVTTVWPQDVFLPRNVTVIGLQLRERIRSYIKDAGCLLLTGPEVCPTMLLEAWAAGTPIVSVYSGTPAGSEELMQADSFVVGGRSCSISALEGTIRDVLDSSEELGLQGRDIVAKNYYWEHLFDQYVDVYEAVLNGRMERIRTLEATTTSWTAIR